MQNRNYPYLGLYTHSEEGTDHHGLRTVVRFSEPELGMQLWTETYHTSDTNVPDLDWVEDKFIPITEEEFIALLVEK